MEALDNARAEALADAGVYRGIQALLAADTGIQFGEEVEQAKSGDTIFISGNKYGVPVIPFFPVPGQNTGTCDQRSL